MVKDVNKARTMLMCPPGTDENTLNLIAFGLSETYKLMEKHSKNDIVKGVVLKQRDVLNHIYTDGGSIQENIVDHSDAYDARICNEIRQFVAVESMDQSKIDLKLQQLSNCKSAESKYLAAFLILKTGSDYDTCSRALGFIEEAYKLEPYNPLYEDFYKGLFEAVERQAARIRQEALERKRMAEAERERVEEQRQARERREEEQRRAREEQQEKETIKFFIGLVVILLIIFSIWMGW